MSFYQDTEIYLHEEFLTTEETFRLLSLVNQLASSSWTAEGLPDREGNYLDFWEGKIVDIKELAEARDESLLSEIENKVKLAYLDVYPDLVNKVFFSYIKVISRFGVGDGMPVHSDRGPHKSNNRILHGLVIYLNDNYNGGELYYPKKDIRIKPKSRSLVIHPGTEEYSHGVSEVLEGTRYAITLFTHEVDTN
jgi:hypothetical protein